MATKHDAESDLTEQIAAGLAALAKAPESALTPEAQAIAAAFAAPAAESKPDISRLPDAVVGGRLVVKPGEKIVIERRASFLAGNPYLDTRTYTLKGADPDTGRMSLWDDGAQQWAADNYIRGAVNGQVYKVALGRAVSTKKKRGRPRKNPVDAPKPPAELGPDGSPVKKKRGRPKGSKNRSKEAIREEKTARAAGLTATRAG